MSVILSQWDDRCVVFVFIFTHSFLVIWNFQAYFKRICLLQNIIHFLLPNWPVRYITLSLYIPEGDQRRDWSKCYRNDFWNIQNIYCFVFKIIDFRITSQISLMCICIYTYIIFGLKFYQKRILNYQKFLNEALSIIIKFWWVFFSSNFPHFHTKSELFLVQTKIQISF